MNKETLIVLYSLSSLLVEILLSKQWRAGSLTLPVSVIYKRLDHIFIRIVSQYFPAPLILKDILRGCSSSTGSSFAGGQELEQKLPNHSVSTPVQPAALDGPSNQSELTGNWTNPIGTLSRFLNSSIQAV